MKTFLLGFVAAVALTAGGEAAMAADMPLKAAPMAPPPAWSWTGFYLGANVGYGWGPSTGNLVGNSTGLSIPLAIAGGTIPTAFNLQDRGVVGGGQFGYNWQLQNWVVGLETDFQGSDIHRSGSLSSPGGIGLVPTASAVSSQLDWFGTFRGRVGVTWNQVLLYGTGGLAYGRVEDSATVATVPAPPLGTGSSSTTRVGWAAGAGVEWALSNAWSVKAEYLHVDLGATTSHVTFATSPTDFLDYRFAHNYDIARVGVNFRLPVHY